MEPRNMILAFALSMLILLGWGMLFPPAENAGPAVEVEKRAAVEIPDEGAAAPELGPDSEDAFTAEPVDALAPTPAPKTTAITGNVITFGSDLLKLSVNEKGWIVGAKLDEYRVSLDDGAPSVSVLGENEPHATYLNVGLLGEKGISPFRLLSKETVNGADRVVLRASLSDGRVWV